MSKLKNIDVAKALGLSPAAVSMAVNGKPGVSDETRERVLAYIYEHGEPSAYPIAASKSSLLLVMHKKTGDILIEKPFFSTLVNSIEAHAKASGYVLTISYYDGEADPGEYITSLNAMNPGGVLLMATEIDMEALSAYRTLKAPFVLLDGTVDRMPADSVTLENGSAIFRAYEYAWNMGHRRIGYLKCKTEIPNFQHRLNGFHTARRILGADDEKPVIFSLPGNLKESNREMKEILSRLPEGFEMPTCFLADLDYIAIGAMTALKQTGYRVPDDVSVIGYDDIEFSALCSPPLTTIRLHEEEMGRIAVQLLLDRMEHPQQCVKNIQLGTELIVRKSVKQLSEGQSADAASMTL